MKFQTTLATLTRVDGMHCIWLDDNVADSMLAVMFSGRYNLTKDEDGCLFIDRDGTHFRFILKHVGKKTLCWPSIATSEMVPSTCLLTLFCIRTSWLNPPSTAWRLFLIHWRVWYPKPTALKQHRRKFVSDVVQNLVLFQLIVQNLVRLLSEVHLLLLLYLFILIIDK